LLLLLLALPALERAGAEGDRPRDRYYRARVVGIAALDDASHHEHGTARVRVRIVGVDCLADCALPTVAAVDLPSVANLACPLHRDAIRRSQLLHIYRSRTIQPERDGGYRRWVAEPERERGCPGCYEHCGAEHGELVAGHGLHFAFLHCLSPVYDPGTGSTIGFAEINDHAPPLIES
jgi:hypothetical protein